MSNSSVKTFAQTGSKVFFVAAERIERTVRLQGAWLSIVDVSVPAGVSGTAQTIGSEQVLRIIEGRLTIWRMTDQGREEMAVSAGDILHISAGQAHGYCNDGATAAAFSAIIDSDAAGQLAAPAEASGSPVAAQRMGAAANSGSTRIRAA